MYEKTSLIRIGVGSRNPVKIEAVHSTFHDAFGHLGIKKEVEVKGHDVDSGVPDQPIGLETIYKGAGNRARKVMSKGMYDYYVGLEAGIYKIDKNYIDLQFCVILDNDGRETVGHSGGFTYPDIVIKDVLAGQEVGDIFARLSGNGDIKRQEGAIGMLSKGFIDRTTFGKQSVMMALIPRISPSLYQE